MTSATTEGTETSPLDALLRPDEVAQMLGVRRSSVYEYARAGLLPHVRIGRHVRFVREDVAEWVRRQRRL